MGIMTKYRLSIPVRDSIIMIKNPALIVISDYQGAATRNSISPVAGCIWSKNTMAVISSSLNESGTFQDMTS
jgi:hypothetical protein